MVFNFLRRHYRAYHWARAMSLSSRGEFEKSLSVLNSLSDSVREKIHWRLFEMHQLGLLNKHLPTLMLAEDLIDFFASKSDPTPDQKYCLAFAQWYGLVAFMKLHKDAEIPEKFMFDLTSINLEDVSGYCRQTFPLSIHPDWSERAARVERQRDAPV